MLNAQWKYPVRSLMDASMNGLLSAESPDTSSGRILSIKQSKCLNAIVGSKVAPRSLDVKNSSRSQHFIQFKFNLRLTSSRSITCVSGDTGAILLNARESFIWKKKKKNRTTELSRVYFTIVRYIRNATRFFLLSRSIPGTTSEACIYRRFNAAIIISRRTRLTETSKRQQRHVI